LKIAEQINNGNWLSEIFVAPVVPLLSASFMYLFSDPRLPFIFYNIVLSSLLVPVLYYLAKELFNNKIGWLMVIWGIFYEDYSKRIIYILKEPTINFLLPLILLLFIKSLRNRNNFWYVFFFAVSFSYLIHVDERYFAYLPLFALGYLLEKPFNINKSINKMLIWVGIILIFMLPWGIRNYLAYDQVVILSPRTTAFTSKFWGNDISKTHFSDNSQNIFLGTSLSKAEEFGKNHGITPREYGKYEKYGRAFVNFWQPTYFQATYIQYGYRPMVWSTFHNIKSIFFYGIFLPFYLIGIFFLFKEKNYLGLFLCSIPILHSLMHTAMVWPLERYRSPITFIVVMIGIWAIQQLYLKIISGQAQSRKIQVNSK
jgi:hypothetical protein